MPTKPLFSPTVYPVLARLPTWSIALYLIALLIVGVRIRKLEWTETPALRFPGDHIHVRNLDKEAMGASAWGGIGELALVFVWRRF
jgi:hypothetical protein